MVVPLHAQTAKGKRKEKRGDKSLLFSREPQTKISNYSTWAGQKKKKRNESPKKRNAVPALVLTNRKRKKEEKRGERFL